MLSYNWLCAVILFACTDLTIGYRCEGLHCVDDECAGNGVCTLGCQAGFVVNRDGQCYRPCPEHCTECLDSVCTVCVTGRYGNKCTITCEGCINGQCDFKTGHCKHGCKDGYREKPECNVSMSGDNEMELVTMETDKGERNVYIWIASCLISTIIVAVVIIIIYISLQRKRGWKSYDVHFENTGYHRPETGEEQIELNEM